MNRLNQQQMKNVFLYIVFTGIVFTQYACKKELNALPDQSKVDGNVIVDGKSAEVALNGAYYRLAESGDDRGTPSTMTVFTHEILPAQLAGSIDYQYGGSDAARNIIVSESYTALPVWTASYLLVNAANGVIKGVKALPEGKITEQRRNEILGEAMFLRAYGHYRLLGFYAQYFDVNSNYGVMLRTEPVTTSNIAKARSTVSESYASILEDIDFAITNAPANNVNHYASSWTAKALKARVLINRGAQGDYENVIAITEDIMQNGPYELEGNLRDIFSTKGLESKEVIMGTFPMPGQLNKKDTYFNGPAYIPTTALVDLLNGDPRANWVLGDIQGQVGITKYKGPGVEVAYMFRLTEIYLLRAEAIVRSGGSLDDARGLVKTVQQHAGLTDFSALDNAATPEAMLMEIYKETARNLLCEDGQDWFALLRLPFGTVKILRPTIISKDQYIMPIPRTEFQKNSAIGDQNPGYNK